PAGVRRRPVPGAVAGAGARPQRGPPPARGGARPAARRPRAVRPSRAAAARQPGVGCRPLRRGRPAAAGVPGGQRRGAARSGGACRWLAYTNTRLEATCTAERRALAVFVEQWAPGWRAFVDGQPAPLERANLVMRAVAIPPGPHVVALRYQGPGLAAGEGISAV